MPLKFHCTNCSHNMIVRYLKVGEEAECKVCRTKNIVPDTAVSPEKIATSCKLDISYKLQATSCKLQARGL